MTPLGLERFGCLLRHSGGSRPQNTQEHEKHHEAEGLSHTGCSGYWAGIHEHRLIVLECWALFTSRALLKACVTKGYNFALCGFIIDAPRIAPKIALPLCTASVSQYFSGPH